MIRWLRRRIFGYRRVAGVEYHTTENREVTLNITLIHITGGLIKIEGAGAGIPMEELAGRIAPGTPVCLSITGRGVINRAVTPGTPEDELIQSVLPGARRDQFYMENTSGRYVSLCRVDTVSEVTENFSKAGLPVIRIRLGPFAVKDGIELIENRPAVIIAGMNEFTVSDKGIESWRQRETAAESQYRVGGTLLEGINLISYTTALQALLPSVHVMTGETEREFKNKRIFMRTRWAALMGFLFLLLVNFMIFTGFSGRNVKFLSEVAASQDQLSRVQYLEEKIAGREKFLTSGGWFKPSVTSFYADRIGASVPGPVTLLKLNIYPVVEQKTGQENLHFDQNQISISGLSSQSRALNEWIKTLDELDWIEKVALVNYHTGTDDAIGMFNLSIEIR